MAAANLTVYKQSNTNPYEDIRDAAPERRSLLKTQGLQQRVHKFASQRQTKGSFVLEKKKDQDLEAFYMAKVNYDGFGLPTSQKQINFENQRAASMSQTQGNFMKQRYANKIIRSNQFKLNLDRKKEQYQTQKSK